MSKIAIVGPGAIGGTIAAWLMQDPQHEVVLGVRSPLRDLVIETPYGRIMAEPGVWTQPSEAREVDWVLIATKAYHVSETAAWFPKLLGRATRVAVLQNGVEHVERFSSFVDRDRILPVVVDLPAERTAPGRIVQRGPALVTVPDTDAGRAFRDLFPQTRIQISVTGDFVTAAWAKLCLNSVGAVSAVTGIPSKVIQVAGVAELMHGIARECVDVVRAEGARLDEATIDSVMEKSRCAPGDSVNSLFADRLAGRPMEIDARNGAIVRAGKRHGIPTPLNEAMVALLNAVQGERRWRSSWPSRKLAEAGLYWERGRPARSEGMRAPRPL